MTGTFYVKNIPMESFAAVNAAFDTSFEARCFVIQLICHVTNFLHHDMCDDLAFVPSPD